MGMLMNLTIFYFCVAFFLWMLGYSNVAVNLASCFDPALTGGYVGTCPVSSFSLTLGLFLTGFVGIAISIFFPNYVAMFIPFAVGLVGLLMWPSQFIDEMGAPPEVKLFLMGMFGITWLYGIVFWLKGNEG